jgi:hypothetical protein
VPLLLALLEHPRFAAGQVHTGWLDAESRTIRAGVSPEAPPEVAAIARAARAEPGPPGTAGAGRATGDLDPWTSLRDARV